MTSMCHKNLRKLSGSEKQFWLEGIPGGDLIQAPAQSRRNVKVIYVQIFPRIFCPQYI